MVGGATGVARGIKGGGPTGAENHDFCADLVLFAIYLIKTIAVSDLTEHCNIFHFPPYVSPYVTGMTSQLFLII